MITLNYYIILGIIIPFIINIFLIFKIYNYFYIVNLYGGLTKLIDAYSSLLHLKTEKDAYKLFIVYPDKPVILISVLFLSFIPLINIIVSLFLYFTIINDLKSKILNLTSNHSILRVLQFMYIYKKRGHLTETSIYPNINFSGYKSSLDLIRTTYSDIYYFLNTQLKKIIMKAPDLTISDARAFESVCLIDYVINVIGKEIPYTNNTKLNVFDYYIADQKEFQDLKNHIQKVLEENYDGKLLFRDIPFVDKSNIKFKVNKRKKYAK